MLRVHFSEVLHLARAHTHKHTHTSKRCCKVWNRKGKVKYVRPLAQGRLLEVSTYNRAVG
jgi:hypothetical protein